MPRDGVIINIVGPRHLVEPGFLDVVMRTDHKPVEGEVMVLDGGVPYKVTSVAWHIDTKTGIRPRVEALVVYVDFVKDPPGGGA